MKPGRKTSEWIRAVALVVLAMSAFRCCFTVSDVKTASMADCLIPGDAVLISHAPGSFRDQADWFTLPLSELWGENDRSLQTGNVEMFRFSSLKTEDVVAFRYPGSRERNFTDRPVFIKRIIGLPGDVVAVQGGELYVGNKRCADLPWIRRSYLIRTDASPQVQQELVALGLEEGGPLAQHGEYLFALNSAERDKVCGMRGVLEVAPEVQFRGAVEEALFPESDSLGWNRDWLGPYVIPFKGMRWEAGSKHSPLYAELIRKYEDPEVEYKNGKLIRKGRVLADYKFAMDYYFVAGDHRGNSNDSRQWGPVPENHMLGKVRCVLFSSDPAEASLISGIRWSRFLHCKLK